MQSQTEFTVEDNEQCEYCVSRVDPIQVGTEVTSPNEAPPTMSTNQLEISHELIMASVEESADKATTTKNEENTPLNRENLQQAMGVKLIVAATRKGRCKLFTEKRTLRLAYGDYWYNVRNRLHVKYDCLLFDKTIIIPQQFGQIILHTLHLTLPRAAAMLELSENI